ncbi:GerAB/ArcD/ProY family transporter [Pseudobacillus sp. FSL P4-0506]|uniref:GerAB/ArcD/ProY family transporter n=1 Tax=unclassified Pseudobacillus TaxID=2619284 RepID=UPI0030FBE087
MNRYYYYLLAVNMFTHMVTSVPIVLYQARKEGAIVSMIFALLIGTVIIYWQTHIFTRFPEKGYPELLKEYMSKWIAFPLLVLTAIVWFIAGLITLITYSDLLKRFLTPEMPVIGILVLLLLFVSFGILMNSKSVLYTIEIVLLLSIPFTIFIFTKMYFDEGMNWDFVKEAMTYVVSMPDYSSFSAAIYVILGPANLIVFNRVFARKQKINWKYAIVIGLTGALALFTSYFIPIGFQGFMNMDVLVHPWLVTADSIRMK